MREAVDSVDAVNAVNEPLLAAPPRLSAKRLASTVAPQAKAHSSIEILLGTRSRVPSTAAPCLYLLLSLSGTRRTEREGIVRGASGNQPPTRHVAGVRAGSRGHAAGVRPACLYPNGIRFLSLS